MTNNERRGVFIEVLKLSPIVLLGILMVGIKLDFLIAAPISTIYVAIIAWLTEKFSFNEIVEKAVNSVKEIQLVFFILMLAYAMAEAFMASGVGASIIIMSLNLGLTGKTIAVTGIIVTSVLSITIGTSWGTFAACAPIFLWLNHIVGGNILLTLGAIAGGACFGDNIGLISDTTVVSSGIQKVEVIHRIRHQGVWSLGCLIVGIITFYVVSVMMGLPNISGNVNEAINQIPDNVWEVLKSERESAIILLNQVKDGVPLYMCLPLIFVLISAIKGFPTLACLFIGIISSLVFGLISGTIPNISEFLDLMYTGFSSAGASVIIMMMWITAFGGIMGSINAFEPLSRIVKRISKNVRQLMFYNGVFSILGNVALADEMAQIVTIGPIIKNLVDETVEGSEEEKYKLRLRNGCFSDAMGVFGSQFIPWHTYTVFFTGIASFVYPLYEFRPTDIMKYNFLSIIVVISILILTLTGLDKFIPLFNIPEEPKVKLKK